MHSANLSLGFKDIQFLRIDRNLAWPDAAGYQQGDAKDLKELSRLHVMPLSNVTYKKRYQRVCGVTTDDAPRPYLSKEHN
jgi:hypothetical protein